jgi:predicted MFS family arabinose efflux permease
MIGGLVVARYGEATCFALNALSFLGVMAALAVMQPHPVPTIHRSVSDALRDGLAYVGNHQAIRLLLFIVATMALFSGSYQTLLPYFARHVYGGDVKAFGLMTAAGGCGACLGTIFLASHRDIQGIERRIVWCALIVAMALGAFAATRAYPVALATMVIMGFCSINTVAASNALIQSLVDGAMRGRVMALFSMAFFGLSPVGNLLAGWGAARFGAQATLLACAAAVMTMAILALIGRRSIDFALPSVDL